jgi:hypothetical protein
MSTDSGLSGWPNPNAIRCPGLTPRAPEILRLVEGLPKKLAVFSYKQGTGCLWIVLLGGTGTGKSTLFNLICGDSLSATGVERPKTTGPVTYVHRECDIEKGFPFTSISVDRYNAVGKPSEPVSGSPGHLTVLEHEREEFAHLLWVDAPDLDSVAERNREIAEDLYLLADVIVFVMSQEKYADETPFKVLSGMIRDKRSHFLVVNKVQTGFDEGDVLGLLQSQGIAIGDNRIWVIPRAPSAPVAWLSEDSSFRAFYTSLLDELATEVAPERRATEQARLGGDLREELSRLTELLEAEALAAQEWLAQLENLYREISRGFLATEKDRFAEKSRDYLRAEIRRLFARYDVLARPRKAIQWIVLAPLRFLGLMRRGARGRQRQALTMVGRKADIRPIRECIEKFNRLVLARLSPPSDGAPLYEALRRQDIPLSDEEIEEALRDNQEKLLEWLEETFQSLSQGLPLSKKWGMYSTSVLWGILILAFETTIGGGFTALDAALDSALAPFVTKGTVELFAYREIQKITRELAQRYQEGLLAILGLQKDRYETSLRALLTPKEALEEISVLQKEFQARYPVRRYSHETS